MQKALRGLLLLVGACLLVAVITVGNEPQQHEPPRRSLLPPTTQQRQRPTHGQHSLTDYCSHGSSLPDRHGNDDRNTHGYSRKGQGNRRPFRPTSTQPRRPDRSTTIAADVRPTTTSKPTTTIPTTNYVLYNVHTSGNNSLGFQIIPSAAQWTVAWSYNCYALGNLASSTTRSSKTSSPIPMMLERINQGQGGKRRSPAIRAVSTYRWPLSATGLC